jgi:proteasome lid subunit RPN8/RPN11
MKRIWLSEEHARQIVQHAQAERPREACGIIGGIGERAHHVIPVANLASDPQHEYRLDDQALAGAMRGLNRQGLSIIAFYHSHPSGDPIPSPVDIAQAAYPDTPYLIVGLRQGEPKLAGWNIKYGEVMPVELHIGTQPPPLSDDPLSGAQKAAIVLSALIAFVFMLILSVTLLPPAPPIP